MDMISGGAELARARDLRARAYVPPAPPALPYAPHLDEDRFSPRWWRGAAALGAMSGMLVLAAPWASLPVNAAPLPTEGRAAQYRAAGVSALETGGMTGLRMAADARVEPLAEVPERPFRELVATVGGDDTLEASLRRAGVAQADAKAAAAAVAAAAPGKLEDGTRVNIRLGRAGASGARPIESLNLRARYNLRVVLTRQRDAFSLRKERIAVASAPLRIRGKVQQGLYWSMRGAGITPRAAADYLKALGGKIDVGSVMQGDTFDLVLEKRITEAGEEIPGPLLLASIDRQDGGPLSLVKWRLGGKEEWIDPTGNAIVEEEGMSWPVNAPISSGFGMRRHPILRYKRMHKGVDFRTGHGAPVYAAADGNVTRAGWAGGYGRQVRLSHEEGIGTSYSHLSRISVPSGTYVTRGQLIGYTGSTGLSTGPHLHYEVYRGGRAVDPYSVRMVRRPLIDPREMELVKARYRELRQIRPTSV